MLQEFLLENGGLFLTGPEDSGSTDVRLQEIIHDEEDKISKRQVWIYDSSRDGPASEVVENGSSGFLDIDWNFAGTGEYSGSGAPVLAWQECHGGNNQRFYLASFKVGKDEFAMVGRSADLEEGFSKDHTFLSAEQGKAVTMLRGVLGKPTPSQKWKMISPGENNSLHKPFSWKEWADEAPFPENALIAGSDGGSDVYVTLATYGTNEFIGKLHARDISCKGRVSCYIAKEEEEIELKHYKILCLEPGYEAEWKDVKDMSGDDLQFKVSVPFVKQSVGRATISGQVTPGRIEDRRGEPVDILYVPYGGYNETTNYQVLLIKKKTH